MFFFTVAKHVNNVHKNIEPHLAQYYDRNVLNVII